VGGGGDVGGVDDDDGHGGVDAAVGRLGTGSTASGISKFRDEAPPTRKIARLSLFDLYVKNIVHNPIF
jgi:hypothetical protein